jgi:hypothetical protein
MAASWMASMFRSKTARASFWIFLAVFLALLILVIPSILTVNVAFSASPDLLTKENSGTAAGYEGNTYGFDISYVQGSWTVPTVTCPSSGTSEDQFLIGFGGWGGGFEYSCSGGAAGYTAFYIVDTLYGKVPSGDKVFAGDAMKISVNLFADAWQILLKDKTQGWEIDNVSEGVSQGNYFEYVAGSSVPNPNFGQIKVTNACVTAVTNCEGLNYYAKGSDFSLGQYTWVNPSTNDTLASVTNLKAKGSNFTIMWNASS